MIPDCMQKTPPIIVTFSIHASDALMHYHATSSMASPLDDYIQGFALFLWGLSHGHLNTLLVAQVYIKLQLPLLITLHQPNEPALEQLYVTKML